MNIVDVILILVVLLSVWGGWRKGFMAGSIGLITWLGSLVAAFLLYPWLAELINKYLPSWGVWSAPVAFIVLLIIFRSILGMLSAKLMIGIPEGTHDHPVNKSLGVIPGLITGVINAMVIAALLLALPLFDGLSASTRNSLIAEKLTPPAEWIESKLSSIFGKAAERTMNKLTVKPGSKESVKLPFTVTDVRVREDLEEKMLELVNEERIKEGLSPLIADTALRAVARAHSRDMFARGYFAHITPDGKSPFDRIREARITFITAGENLALAQTIPIAHQGLMNSPGHRANILRSSFGRVGIGVVSGGMHGLMITQAFRN